MNYNDKRLEKFCEPEQLKCLKAMRKHASFAEAARSINKDPSNLQKALKAVEKKAAKVLTDLHDATLNPLVPEGYHVKGASTAVRNADGLITWIKTDIDKERQEVLFKAAIDAMKEQVEPLPEIKKEFSISNDDLMVVIPIGDAHIGMLAWGEECGEDYDLRIAESVHRQAIDTLIAELPVAKTCAIIDTGDFVHADNIMGITTRSGHNLDMDGRLQKVIRVVIRLVIYYITKALEKFDNVIYRPEVGNHNDVGAKWIQEWLHVMFEQNPRVTIGNSPGNAFFWQHGLCFFGSHHGHEMKPDRLKDVMNNHIIKHNINVRFRKWFCGHIHHSSSKDLSGVMVESYATMAPKDAYSAGHGYDAERAMCAEIWHKTKGKLRTHHFGSAMLKAEG